MKFSRAACITVLILASLTFAGQSPVYYYEPDAVVKIDMAQRNGSVPAPTALVYKVMALTGSSKLPAELASETPLTCGTPVMDELVQCWPSLDYPLQQEIISYLPEASLFTHDHVDAAFTAAFTNLFPFLNKSMKSRKNKNHFVLYYATEGSNAVSSAKYVKNVGKVLEYSYKKIMKMYGKSAKNPEPMPVFFIERDYGACTYVGPSGAPPTAESYITMERDLDQKTLANYKKYGSQLVDAVPCHEYFHAVQNNFDCTEGKFMKESSSSWIEGIVYRNNKLYVVFRVPLVYNTPHWPLWYGSGYQGTLFQRFCQEFYNTTAINPSIWKKCEETAGDNGMAAISAVLADRGTTWDEAIKNYGANNFFYRYWDYKKMKDFWPVMPSAEHNAFGVEPTVQDVLYELGSQYIVMNPPADLALKKGAELLVKFKQGNGSSVATLLMETKNRKFDMFDVPADAVDALGYYELLVDGFGKKYSKAVLMVQNRASTGADLNKKSFTYAAACPQVTMKSFEAAPTTIGPGQSSTMTITFDVKGCWNTMDYPLKYKAHFKGPGKVVDGVTDLVINVKNGAEQKKNLYFNAGYGEGYVSGSFDVGIQFVFGTSKKMSSYTDIIWTTVTLEKVENNSLSDGSSAPPSLTIE